MSIVDLWDEKLRWRTQVRQMKKVHICQQQMTFYFLDDALFVFYEFMHSINL